MTYFLIIYISTIVVTRVCLKLWPRHAPKIGNFQLHHYMYGVVLALICFLFFNTTILAIGLGLVVDELPLFFIFKTWNWPDDHWKQYHSKQSIYWIIGISLIGYLIVLLLK